MHQLASPHAQIRPQCKKGAAGSLLGGAPESEYIGGAGFPPSTVVLVLVQIQVEVLPLVLLVCTKK